MTWACVGKMEMKRRTKELLVHLGVPVLPLRTNFCVHSSPLFHSRLQMSLANGLATSESWTRIFFNFFSFFLFWCIQKYFKKISYLVKVFNIIQKTRWGKKIKKLTLVKKNRANKVFFSKNFYLIKKKNVKFCHEFSLCLRNIGEFKNKFFKYKTYNIKNYTTKSKFLK